MSKRITIDFTDAAAQEIDRLCTEYGLSVPDLFRAAMSVFRVHNRQLDEIAALSRSHHADQKASVLLHSLTVDIPAACERMKYAPARGEGEGQVRP